MTGTILTGTKDIHEESLSFQKKVRDIYLRVAQSDESSFVVNCSDNEGKMHAARTIFRTYSQDNILKKN